MDNGKLSVRYARALLSTAEAQHCEKEVYEGLVRLTGHYGAAISQFNEILNNPVIGQEEKIRLLETAIGDPIHDCLRHFLHFVTEHKREDKIFLIALKYQEMYREEKNILRTDVTAAAELPESSLNQIKDFVEQTFHCTAELRVKVNPSLIGGFILDIENNRMDAILAGQLEALKQKLNE